MKDFVAYTLAGISVGSINVLAALGYTLIYRVLHLLDLTYSAVLIIGTFAAWYLEKTLGKHLGTALNIVVVGLATVAVCVILELAVERIVIRHLVKRRSDLLSVIVATLGVFYILQEALNHWQGPLPVSVALPFRARTAFSIAGSSVTNVLLITVLGAALSVGCLVVWSRRTQVGRSLEAVAQDRVGAALTGIAVYRVEMATFVVVGIVAGLGALFYDVTYTSTAYGVALPLCVTGLAAAVLGGMGNISGAVVGGLVLGLGGSYCAALFGATWQDTLSYVLLIVVVLIRPEGLLRERTATVRA
jgi:branched-chain amino acid transport system permease protein